MPAKRTGIFITFEGTEGAGKSTLIQELAARLKSPRKVTITREPGGSPVAEKIRRIILEEPMDPWAELFLYEAARAEHLEKTIRPALARGELVLCDRYGDSSLAYQANARGLPWKEVKALNRTATRGLIPDLTVLLDIDPAIGLARARDQNRFEAEGVEFQKKVRQGYLKSRKEDPSRWLVIRVDGKTREEIRDFAVREILRRMKKKLGARNG